MRRLLTRLITIIELETLTIKTAERAPNLTERLTILSRF